MSTMIPRQDWSSGWLEDEMDKLRRFRSLSAAEKVRAVEEMQAVKVLLLGKGRIRTGGESGDRSRKRGSR